MGAWEGNRADYPRLVSQATVPAGYADKANAYFISPQIKTQIAWHKVDNMTEAINTY